MIIVSQDKTKTTESLTLKIEVCVLEEGEFPNIKIKQGNAVILDKDNVVLGEYKTEERAQQIIKEITQKYSNTIYRKYGNDYIKQNRIYEMPKE